MSKENTSSRVEGLELIMERTFDAPKELVFSMFVDREHIAHWWGPIGWDTVTYEMNVEPGGVWHYCMRSSDGQESWGKSIYRTVDPPDRIVYEDAFSDEQGNIAEGMPTMFITLHFSSEENGSTLVSRTAFESQEELQKIMDMQVVDGMSETYDRLENYLTDLQKNRK